MKRTLLSVLVVATATFAGCTPGLHRQVDERLTSLPIQPHTNDVDVFFGGEWPKEEYIKIAALETRGGENVAYIEQIKSLKAKARGYGADAVVVQEKKFISDVSTDVISDRVSTLGWGVLTGIAIKYKKNLDMGLVPKYQEIEMYDPVVGDFQPLLTLHFSPSGEIQGRDEKHETATIMYNNYIHNFTFRTLQAPGNGWVQRAQEGYVVERELHKAGELQKRIEFEYDVERRLKQVRIQNVRGAAEEINYLYDEAGRLTQRIINRSSTPYLQEEYTYDAEGKVSEVQLYNINLPERLPVLRSFYAYYTLEEL